MSSEIANEYEKFLDTIINDMMSKIKPYKWNIKFDNHIKNYWKYRNAWDKFKEDYSHIHCVLLERFMQ